MVLHRHHPRSVAPLRDLAKEWSPNKTYKGLEMSWRFPPRGWLNFNVCGVVFEDKAGGGGVLRDADGVTRLESRLSYMKVWDGQHVVHY
ncbi:hypothetical protein PVK06_025346 [Gossypium arboreum]|uniref:Uncharacterized protein n=1 Tax=Gossypium arboreum TaxID=29729 RepID=A0ABR0PGK3_GOSAR|nr:hypothetical protein PVK06_025346 [Gossypium arboreum]